MASSIMFEATKLPMLGKSNGAAKPDAEGYYTIVMGGFNTFNNSQHHFYTLEGVRRLFESSSLLMRRVANGALRAEVDHPSFKAGMTQDEYLARLMHIDLNNVCGHIRRIWLDENFGKNHPEYKNPDLVALMGEVKPEDPKGGILRQQLENPSANCCFSIRAISDELIVQRRRVRIVTDIYAIDLVNEGGITVASKWDTPSVENVDNSIILPETKDLISRIQEESLVSVPVSYEALERIRQGNKGVATTESSREMADLMINNYFKAERSKANPPKYTGW